MVADTEHSVDEVSVAEDAPTRLRFTKSHVLPIL